MILHDKIITQLHAKQESFRAFDAAFRHEAASYQAALRDLADWSYEKLWEVLNGVKTPGALPTAEFDEARDLRVHFPQQWSNHQEARDWACAALLEHTVIAADGSQILPTSDFSIPVAALQVAWFENHHTRDGRYTKDIAFEILAPDELMVEYNGEQQVSEQVVSLHRFRLETATLCRLMKQLAAERKTRLPLALFDSSLVISFADRLNGRMREQYVESVLELLRCSEATGVPVVGYVDTSQARDLTNMLAACAKLDEAERLHDAQMLSNGLQWGARTPIFICARGSADRKQEGVLASFEEYERGIGFVYLKTNKLTPPARLDIPLWVYERGLLDEVLDLVRAEVIVGNGYPYALEAADAAAVINTRDRAAFYALFQRFTEECQIELHVAQKAASKARRR